MNGTVRIFSSKGRVTALRRIGAALAAIIGTHVSAADITVDFAGDRALIPGSGQPRSDCSLREAIHNVDSKSSLPSNKCAAGTGDDTIVFAPSVSSVQLDTAANGVLSINSNGTLRIRGRSYQDKVAIDGQDLGPILDLDNSDATLRIENMILEHGNRDGNGGAILQKGGTLVLEGCVFKDNNAIEGGAVAVDSFDSTLLVDDCLFRSNLAYGEESAVVIGYGGAIKFAGRDAKIRNSMFMENIAHLSGGAIACLGTGTMKISGNPAANQMLGENNSLFLRNTTNYPNDDIYGAAGGGALFTECDLNVGDTRFEDNNTEGKGGAVRVGTASLGAYFHRVAFEKNRATTTMGGPGYGGAAAVEGYAIFNRVSAGANEADYGGAFLVRGINGNHIALVLNSTLWENRALLNNGAAMYFAGPFGMDSVVVVHSTFDANGGGGDGNTLFFGNGIAQPVKFENNILQSANGDSNCGGIVTTSSFDPIDGTFSVQYDGNGVDSCANGNPSHAIPIKQIKFSGSGIVSAVFPFMRASPINRLSPAAKQPGASPLLCTFAGSQYPPDWVAQSIGIDQLGKLRDAAHCSMGALSAGPALISIL